MIIHPGEWQSDCRGIIDISIIHDTLVVIVNTVIVNTVIVNTVIVNTVIVNTVIANTVIANTVIANKVKQSSALYFWIAASASPSRNDESFRIP